MNNVPANKKKRQDNNKKYYDILHNVNPYEGVCIILDAPKVSAKKIYFKQQ